ncbi:hypothetical protein P7K49_015996 [Saguinus oedipus]|uniref:Fibronectin type-III domain-containing protein n=1 Tax=Saguinus oedipus TaxID=9490 RepID=A0ABQ9VBA1_SAGOE|nr:hypothetical protein P7K49_015996 [Saguinus oedipus]
MEDRVRMLGGSLRRAPLRRPLCTLPTLQPKGGLLIFAPSVLGPHTHILGSSLTYSQILTNCPAALTCRPPKGSHTWVPDPSLGEGQPPAPARPGLIRPPSAPRDLQYSLSRSPLALRLRWLPPADSGGRSDVTYSLLCLRCGREGPAGACEPCGPRVAFVPRQAGLRERAATLLHLRPGARYTVRVAALNGVSGPAAAAGATYAQVTVSTGPGGKAACPPTRVPRPEAPAPATPAAARGRPVGPAEAPPARPREATFCARTPPLSGTQSHPRTLQCQSPSRVCKRN